MTPQALTVLVRSTVTILALATVVAALGGFAATTQPLPIGLLPSPALVQAATLVEPSAPVPSPGTLMSQLVNADRVSFGLQPLVYDQELTDVARWRSEDMAARAYFSHDIGNMPGRVVFEVLQAQGVRYRAAGENLARTNGSAEHTAAVAEASLMDSPTHRANILRPDYTHLGVGVAVAPDGRVLYTQLFKTAW